MYEPQLDCARAESFGSVAAQYDHYRLTYPDALIEDLNDTVAGLLPALRAARLSLTEALRTV